MDAKDILSALRVYTQHHKYALMNTYVFDWESDFFSVTKTGTVYEIEVKISKADFKKDFEKRRKHVVLSNADRKYAMDFSPEVRSRGGRGWYWNEQTRKHEYSDYCTMEWIDMQKQRMPNRFLYACPEGLIGKHEVPKYAGLLYMRSSHDVYCVKQPPFLHKRDLLADAGFKQLLLDKFYYLSEDARFLLKKNRIPFKEFKPQNI